MSGTVPGGVGPDGLGEEVRVGGGVRVRVRVGVRVRRRRNALSLPHTACSQSASPTAT